MNKENYLALVHENLKKGEWILNELESTGKTELRQSLLKAFRGEGPEPIDSDAHVWLLRSRYVAQWLHQNGHLISEKEREILKNISEMSRTFIENYYFKKA